MLIKMSNIRQFAAQIVQEFQPERVILFGSYAYGTPTPDSDVDLLVVMSCEGKETRKAIEILHTINPKIPIDLLVRTPEHLQQRLAWNDFFLQEVVEKGQVLYEAPHS
jgi:predicted nucleotidyltransferase